MSLSASIKIELQYPSVTEIIDCLICSGWSIYDEDSCINFLPINDNEYYSWTKEKLTNDQFRSLIEAKEDQKEVIGVLLYKDNICGTSVLFLPSNEIVFSCDINRKVIELQNGNSFTDINWYVNELVAPLINKGYKILNFDYSETR